MRDVSDVGAVQKNGARGGVVESEEQTQHRALTGSGRADQRNRLPSRNLQQSLLLQPKYQSGHPENCLYFFLSKMTFTRSKYPENSSFTFEKTITDLLQHQVLNKISNVK